MTRKAFDVTFEAWWQLENQAQTNFNPNFAAACYRLASEVHGKAARLYTRLERLERT